MLSVMVFSTKWKFGIFITTLSLCVSLVILPTVASILARFKYLKALNHFADRSTLFMPIPDVPDKLKEELHACHPVCIPLLVLVHRWKSTLARIWNKFLWLLLSFVIIIVQIVDIHGYQVFPVKDTW